MEQLLATTDVRRAWGESRQPVGYPAPSMLAASGDQVCDLLLVLAGDVFQGECQAGCLLPGEVDLRGAGWGDSAVFLEYRGMCMRHEPGSQRRVTLSWNSVPRSMVARRYAPGTGILSHAHPV